MTRKPNVLLILTDQMQKGYTGPSAPEPTPAMNALAARGVWFDRAYTANAVCSPARASIMTGLLPHNHGVLWVTHTVDPDQGLIRSEKPHWASRLVEAGYDTAYIGKWHVEHDEKPGRYGWKHDLCPKSADWAAWVERDGGPVNDRAELASSVVLSDPPGYGDALIAGITRTPIEKRTMGRISRAAAEQIESLASADAPWCLGVSFPEPHDPFITGRAAYEAVGEIAPPANADDDLSDKPALYRKLDRAWSSLGPDDRAYIRRCYAGYVHELDSRIGVVLDALEASGQAENTIVMLTSDHGDLMGSHRLYYKNISAFEEIYNVPFIAAGPGVKKGAVSTARVGTHGIGPTILDLVGAEPLANVDHASFAGALRDPEANDARFRTGYAEYFGGRVMLTQRVYWNDDWKLVFNTFDDDELYNLADDPHEMTNLARDPAHDATLKRMMREMWDVIGKTGDRSLYNSRYPILRVAPAGPDYDPAGDGSLSD